MASEGKVRPSLYLVEQFVTRYDEGCKNKSLSGKISVEKHKEIESEERIKKIQGREKKLIVSKLWKSQNENCFF